jgi:hypothetical protein
VLAVPAILSARCPKGSEKANIACRECKNFNCVGDQCVAAPVDYISCMMNAGCSFDEVFTLCSDKDLVFAAYNNIPKITIQGKNPFATSDVKYRIEVTNNCSISSKKLTVKSDKDHIDIFCGQDPIKIKVEFEGDAFKKTYGPYVIESKYLTGFYPYNAYAQVNCIADNRIHLALHYIDKDRKDWVYKLIGEATLPSEVKCSN